MNTIRSMTSTRSRASGVLLTFAVAIVVIFGLLAMHTIMTTSSHADAGHEMAAPAAMADGSMVTETAPTAEHCVGDCGASDSTPGHAMLLMTCALALLATLVFLVAPRMLARATLPPGGFVRLLALARALPQPRPPSLLVLSISRT